MASEYDEQHLLLMAFACAPLSANSILSELGDVDAKDLTPEILIDEIELLSRFCEKGLGTFASILRSSLGDSGSVSNDSDIDKNTVVLPTGKAHHKTAVSRLLSAYLIPFYLQRLIRLAHAVEHVADQCRTVHFGEMTTDTTDEIRRLTQMVNKGERPRGTGLSDTLDLTKGLKWEVPDLRIQGGGKVGFNAMAAQRTESRRTVETPLKSGTQQYNRRKVRNPTGYSKFNFAEELDMDVDNDAESEVSGKFKDEAPPGGAQIVKKHSSIDDKTTQIEDKESDPNWGNEERRKAREQRVRRRIPTGHPNMVNSALLARASLDQAAFEEEENRTLAESNH